MHSIGGGGFGSFSTGFSSMDGAQQNSPHDGNGAASPQDPTNAGSSTAASGNGTPTPGLDTGQPQYSEINQILDQILYITDQSLDEAQVNYYSNVFQPSLHYSVLTLKSPSSSRLVNTT